MPAPKRAKAKSRRTKPKALKRRKRVAAIPPFPLPAGWRLDRGGKSISIELKTKDFLDALELFREVAAVAEDLEHHPDLHLTEWNRVRIATWSHDAGGLTKRDERLALRVTELLQRRSMHEHATS